MLMDNYDLQVDIAKKIFLEYDQKQLIRKFDLESDAQYIYLTYLNTPCRIHRKTGSIEESVFDTWQECRDYSTVMTVYDLLCHHKGETAPILSGQWCTVGDFVVTGVTDAEKFTRTACQTLGGVLQTRMAGADLTCVFPVTPFFSVLLQFWQGDEEFPPKLLVLWDRNSDQFLHFETTFYLQGDLLHRLNQIMEK